MIEKRVGNTVYKFSTVQELLEYEKLSNNNTLQTKIITQIYKKTHRKHKKLTKIEYEQQLNAVIDMVKHSKSSFARAFKKIFKRLPSSTDYRRARKLGYNNENYRSKKRLYIKRVPSTQDSLKSINYDKYVNLHI